MCGREWMTVDDCMGWDGMGLEWVDCTKFDIRNVFVDGSHVCVNRFRLGVTE
jgi:hypothetical protein